MELLAQADVFLSRTAFESIGLGLLGDNALLVSHALPPPARIAAHLAAVASADGCAAEVRPGVITDFP